MLGLWVLLREQRFSYFVWEVQELHQEQLSFWVTEICNYMLSTCSWEVQELHQEQLSFWVTETCNYMLSTCSGASGSVLSNGMP